MPEDLAKAMKIVSELAVDKGDALTLVELDTSPALYRRQLLPAEASLVKELENVVSGRPSTYAITDYFDCIQIVGRTRSRKSVVAGAANVTDR